MTGTDALADWPVIHTYTRAQAIADGTLHQVPADIAREAGFRVGVAITNSVWLDCVEWTEADTTRTGELQHQDGRLWDVLYMTMWAIRNNPGCDRVTVRMVRIDRDNPQRRDGEPEAEDVELLAVIGPGDDGEPVIAVMQPHED